MPVNLGSAYRITTQLLGPTHLCKLLQQMFKISYNTLQTYLDC